MMPERPRVTLIPGDGIGPEVIEAACLVLEAAGAKLEWEVVEVGNAALRRGGEPLPAAVLESVRRNGVAFKGPVTTAPVPGFRSVNVALRRELGLYGQVRRCRAWPGVPTRFLDVDVDVIRETTEDLYAGVELDRGSPAAHRLISLLSTGEVRVPADAGLSIKFTSQPAVRKVARFAFEWARDRGRKLVTVVHKATVMRATDGLFLATVREVAATFPDIAIDDCLVDSLAEKLVRSPDRFDVLLTSNLYGDVLGDLAAGLVGGVGLVPGANFGHEVAMFEAAHGSAPRYSGCDRVNPIAAILTGALMLHHLGQEVEADQVERAVGRVLSDGRRVTHDVARHAGAVVGTAAAAAAIIDAMR